MIICMRYHNYNKGQLKGEYCDFMFPVRNMLLARRPVLFCFPPVSYRFTSSSNGGITTFAKLQRVTEQTRILNGELRVLFRSGTIDETYDFWRDMIKKKVRPDAQLAKLLADKLQAVGRIQDAKDLDLDLVTIKEGREYVSKPNSTHKYSFEIISDPAEAFKSANFELDCKITAGAIHNAVALWNQMKAKKILIDLRLCGQLLLQLKEQRMVPEREQLLQDLLKITGDTQNLFKE